MEEYVTYCSACDAKVLVRVEPGAEHAIDPANVVCLDAVPSCADVECPLTGASFSELADRLEFLPSEMNSGESRSLEEAEDLLARARMASLRRADLRGDTDQK